MDSKFLNQVNDWRILLAEDLLLKDKYHDERKLNDAVQSFINEIVFLRICEDKHLPTKAMLNGLIDNPDMVHEQFECLFKESDKKYNSGIFRKDSIVKDLSVKIIDRIDIGIPFLQGDRLLN